MAITQESALTELDRLDTEAFRIRSEISIYVILARGQGASWTQIGEALGITKQAAQQRFGPASYDDVTPDQREARPSHVTT